ncbi:DUF6252 family protein [Flavobacterium sp.]|uniref:DUF6252 family protein n=1 Tax=Flavobacterium sp. TaxID=239 RepID=UPI00260BBF9E|nr:DUF6252 family protein [Flavobacterium sp.]
MKKFIFLFLSGVALISCEKEVEMNSSAMQARINNSFWKAINFNATKSPTNSLTVVGSSGIGNLTLYTTSTAKGTYTLGGTNQANGVSYVLADGSHYSTGITSSSVNKIALTNGGTNYVVAESVATNAISGTGSGLKVKIVSVSAGGVITGVQIDTPGEGYRAGDLITITTGGGNAKVTVQNVSKSNGEITITENTGSTISGEFKFTAFDPETDEVTSCRDGVFYKVPLN